MQAGLYTPQEGRRLLGFSDTEQEDRLLVAQEERVLKILDQIVEEGVYTPPDPLIDLATAEQKAVQYYNAYAVSKLEDDRLQMIQNFFTQVQNLKMVAQSGMQPQTGAAQGQGVPANPEQAPTNEMLPMPGAGTPG